LKEARQAEDSLRKDKDAALASQQYDYAAELRQRELQIDEKIKGLEEDWQAELEQEKAVVTAEDIAEVVSMWTGIPLVQLEEKETERLLHMEEALHKRIIGQDEAIDTIAKAVRRARAGLKDPRHPIGNFIFLGPTGVGKTELVRALAEFMFGSEDTLIRLDMSEYQERHTVSRMVGAPPGYIGYDEGGQLTEAVRRKSYCCILLDEIEKAHPDVFNILLQIFDDGHLTDAKGRRVDFRNSIIVMTSNVGAEAIRKGTTIGFVSHSDEAKTREQAYDRMKENLLGELKKTFRPEFLNRIDSVVVFHSLTKEHIRKIVDLMLATVSQQLAEKEIKLEVTDAAKDFLGEKGYDEVFGARPLRRVIQDMVEDKLSDSLLRGKFKDRKDVFEVKAKLGEAPEETISAIIEVIKGIPGVRQIELEPENLLVVECSKDLRPEIGRAIADNEGALEGELTIETYALAVVDLQGSDISIGSPSGIDAELAPVGALLGDDKQ